MFHKDMRRAERRSRSFHKWMRRLRSDWNDHGWKRDPRYSWSQVNGVFTCEVVGTTLCDCFDLGHKQALRFKDTPTGGHSNRRCGCNEPPLEYRAERQMEARDDWHKRKRREGTWIKKWLCSRCGFLMGKGAVEFHSGRSWGVSGAMCESCCKIMAQRTVYWFNGKRQEFERDILKEPA